MCKVIEQRCPEHLAEFIVSAHTGMRLSEQYSTTWNQVSFERETIQLTKTKNGSSRTVHLDTEATAAIKSVRHRGQKPSEAVFPNENVAFDNRIWFEPCLSEASINDFTWHCNRHTFCSWLAMNGASIREIQVAAGLKTIQMAARYAHLSPAHNQGVVDRISLALQSAATKNTA